MNVEPEQRAALLGEYIAEHSATVRAAARAFGCSKSTVHKDVSTRLRAVAYADTRPVEPGTSEASLRRNRRVEFYFHRPEAGTASMEY